MTTRGDLSDFEWVVIVRAHLASTSVTKAVEIANLLFRNCLEGDVVLRKRRKTSSVKGNNGQKHHIS